MSITSASWESRERMGPSPDWVRASTYGTDLSVKGASQLRGEGVPRPWILWSQRALADQQKLRALALCWVGTVGTQCVRYRKDQRRKEHRVVKSLFVIRSRFTLESSSRPASLLTILSHAHSVSSEWEPVGWAATTSPMFPVSRVTTHRKATQMLLGPIRHCLATPRLLILVSLHP